MPQCELRTHYVRWGIIVKVADKFNVQRENMAIQWVCRQFSALQIVLRGNTVLQDLLILLFVRRVTTAQMELSA